MDPLFSSLFQGIPWYFLLLLLAISSKILWSSASSVIRQTATLASLSNIPVIVIAATIVSFGTILPELCLSVLSHIKGQPEQVMEVALNSVMGCTGLVLGIACLMGDIPVTNKILKKMSWILLGSAALLVAACFPFSTPEIAVKIGSFIEQNWGRIFLALTFGFVLLAVKWAREANLTITPKKTELIAPQSSGVGASIFLLVFGLLALGFSTEAFIATSSEIVLRLPVAQPFVARVFAMLGPSLAELVLAITAVRKGVGEIAIGNVMGASILNILLLIGAAAAAAPGGLVVHPHFFLRLFPALIALLMFFKFGISSAKYGKLEKNFGLMLILIYTMMAYNNITHKGIDW